MSPRAANATVREALIEITARLVAERRPVTVREVAAGAGCSTKAVYTHFGGVEGLRRAVRRHAFARLKGDLASVPGTDDPLTDLAALGWAYCYNALREPDLYRVMFLELPLDAADAVVGFEVFERIGSAVQRCQPSIGGIEDPWAVATQLWMITHGGATLVLAHVMSVADLVLHLRGAAINLFVGLGVSRVRAAAAIQRAEGAMAPAMDLVALGPRFAPYGTLIDPESTVHTVSRDAAS